MAMIGWMFDARASLIANVPTAPEAPYIMSGSGGLDEVRGCHGGGRC